MAQTQHLPFGENLINFPYVHDDARRYNAVAEGMRLFHNSECVVTEINRVCVCVWGGKKAFFIQFQRSMAT